MRCEDVFKTMILYITRLGDMANIMMVQYFVASMARGIHSTREVPPNCTVLCGVDFSYLIQNQMHISWEY